MNTPPPTPGSTPENATVTQKINSEKAQTLYANFCRGTLTPEEVILDLGFNTNSFGVKVLDEDLFITNRVVMSLPTAKRLAMLLGDMLRQHENNFGEIEVDFRRRLKNQPNQPAGPTVG